MPTIMNRRVPVLLACILTAPLWGIGCSGGESTGTVPVSGTLTQSGQPVVGATVTFHPVNGTRSSVGKTDTQGHYTLTTFAAGDGALPGEFRVTVTKYELPPGAVPTDPDPPEEAASGAEAIVPKNVLPAKFADPQASGLTASVSEGPNTIDLHLN